MFPEKDAQENIIEKIIFQIKIFKINKGKRELYILNINYVFIIYYI